ncbi:uncharacterized protein METZ01_LOCUS202966 [marine metagenome]|uniref:Uncharacterized protein n=1 Tax=marine metagenome TaxID=408172 RepID=A0A382EIF3_9ZZZZ
MENQYIYLLSELNGTQVRPAITNDSYIEKLQIRASENVGS